jgi:hypothetical protein
MTPELAALLDGPVAERFVRPTLAYHPDAKAGTDAPQWELRLDPQDSLWYWYRIIHKDGSRRIDEDEWPADPRWLDHLLDVCDDKGWQYASRKHLDNGYHTAVVGVSSHGGGPTRLEALARAMLAVPEVK